MLSSTVSSFTMLGAMLTNRVAQFKIPAFHVTITANHGENYYAGSFPVIQQFGRRDTIPGVESRLKHFILALRV